MQGGRWRMHRWLWHALQTQRRHLWIWLKTDSQPVSQPASQHRVQVRPFPTQRDTRFPWLQAVFIYFFFCFWLWDERLTFATALDSLPETFDAASFIDFPGKASCFVDSPANNCAQLLANSAITSEEFDSQTVDLGVLRREEWRQEELQNWEHS